MAPSVLPMLHGRDHELARVLAGVRAAQAGETDRLVLLGEVGCGKSALLEHAAAAADDAGLTVLRCQAVRGERDVPFAALGLLVGQDDPVPIGVALIDLLEGAAYTNGVAVLVDDAHWMDPDSLRELAYAVRRLRGVGAVTILAGRPQPECGLGALGFDVATIADVAPEAAVRIAVEAANGHKRPPLDRVLALARGNPLALRTLAGDLTDEQLAAPASLPMPPAVGHLADRDLGSYLDELDDALHDVLVVFAADDDPLAEQAISAAGFDPDLLARAELRGVLVADGAGRRFRHPLLRSCIYHAAPLADRRHAHGAWAAVAALDAVRRAWHAAATVVGTDPEVARQLEDAAGMEIARGRPGAASEACARAAALTADAAERARRLMLATQYALAANRPAAALDRAREGIALVPENGSLRAQLLGMRAVLQLRLGDVEAGYATLVEQADRLADQHPEQAAMGLLAASVRDRVVGDYAAMRSHVGRAASLTASVAPELNLLARGNEAVVDVLTGNGDAALATLTDVVPRLNGGVLAGRAGEVVLAPLHAAVWLGQFALAGPILEQRITRMRELGEVSELLYPLVIRSQLRLRSGRVAAALADAREAVRIAEEAELPGQAAVAGGVLVAVEAVLGHEEDCTDHAHRTLELAADGSALGLWSRAALGMLHLGAGRPDAAVPYLRAVARGTARIGLAEPAVIASAPDLVEALVRIGDRPGAAAALQTWALSGADTPWRRGAVARCNGLLAEGDAAVSSLEESIAAFDAAGLHLEAARSRLCLGERLRRDRRRLRAREPLQAAREGFEEMGAGTWAARAADELRATGVSAVSGNAAGRSGVDELTPHELRVATLAAEGRSNPQIAAELYVTRKTIEHHLSQVFRKLGVASRSELAPLLF